MGWHPVNQRLDRVYPDGSIDLQSGGLTVSESVSQMATQKLTSPAKVYLGH